MASLQSKNTNGHKYWYIVESRRVNGKPRPVVLEYLGKADSLLQRLQGLSEYKLKSYAHGHIAALLDLCAKIDICNILNIYSSSQRNYITNKPIRNHLTVGGTLMLSMIARACSPTSKSEFADWAKKTSLSYMLGISLSPLDSRHFWDMMDCLAPEAIEEAELEIVSNVSGLFDLDIDRILYDTTNYFTYIDTANENASIAKRGKSKQKRNDLRQVGLAMAVTKKDKIPVYHHSYEGNNIDSTVFKSILDNIVNRLIKLGTDISFQTIVFDRGVNSKKNLEYTKSLGLHFVGALSAGYHKDIILDAKPNLLVFDENACYRTRREIWGMDLTAVVIISDKLKIGLIRGIYLNIEKCEKAIIEMNNAINKPRARKKTTEQLMASISELLKKNGSTAFIKYSILDGDKPYVEHNIDYQAVAQAEDEVGFKIIMTTRHEWDTSDIIKAYNDLSDIEDSFKNMKTPHHVSLRPQYHWTNQKIRVHNFCCVMGYLLNMLLYKQAREKAGFTGCMSNFLDMLDNIRLGSVIRESGKRGRPSIEYSIEHFEDDVLPIIDIFGLKDLHKNKPKITGLSSY
jgi:transposase